jgi:hypothetical protein
MLLWYLVKRLSEIKMLPGKSEEKKKIKYKCYARYISSVRLTIVFDNQVKQILYLQTFTDFRIEQTTMASLTQS